MEEDFSNINSETRSEKFKNFILNRKKEIIIFFTLLILALMSFFIFFEYKERQKKSLSKFYNSIIINYSENNKQTTIDDMIDVINQKDTTYSPLALYFLVDNQLINDKEKINDLFDILIKKTSLDNEIKNLIIYKKGLFNADHANENELLKILNPIINSSSIWRSHALYLMAEFFYNKNEKKKSKEFFEQILMLEKPNPEIAKEVKKRISRDLSE